MFYSYIVIETNFNTITLYKLHYANDFERDLFTRYHIISLPITVLSQLCFIS